MNRTGQVFGATFMAAALMLAASAHAGKTDKKSAADRVSENSKCWPEVVAEFDGENYAVIVESTKDLSNVVVLFDDGSTERFEDLSGYEGTFAGTGENTGKTITGVWIKSGCNHSGDGPGYGEFIADGSSVGGIPVIGIGDVVGIPEPYLSEFAVVLVEVALSEMVPLASDPVTVNYLTRDGTATADYDYVSDEGVLVFAPGEITKTIEVIVLDDYDYETDESFYIDLSNPTNALLGETSGIVTIVDNDAGAF